MGAVTDGETSLPPFLHPPLLPPAPHRDPRRGSPQRRAPHPPSGERLPRRPGPLTPQTGLHRGPGPAALHAAAAAQPIRPLWLRESLPEGPGERRREAAAMA